MKLGTPLASSPFMSPFRDATGFIEAEVAALEAAHRRQLASIPTGHRSLFVRRTARITAGVTGTIAAAALVVAMVMETRGYSRFLLAGWCAMSIAYAVAAVVASRVLRRRLRPVARTADPFRDRAALQAANPRGVEHELAARRVHASYAWPLVAISLLGPHTLHLLVAIGIDRAYQVRDLDEWIVITSACSVHVFAYAVVTAWSYPRTRVVWTRVLWATALSLAPGILSLGVTSLVVLLSGTVIALVAYLPMGALMRREATTMTMTMTMTNARGARRAGR